MLQPVPDAPRLPNRPRSLHPEITMYCGERPVGKRLELVTCSVALGVEIVGVVGIGDNLERQALDNL